MNLNWIFRYRDNPLALVSRPKPNKENKIPKLSLKERSLPKQQDFAIHQLRPSLHIRNVKSISNVVSRSLDGNNIQLQPFLKYYQDKVCIKDQSMRTASNTDGTNKCCECVEIKRSNSRKVDKTKTASQIFRKKKPLLSLNTKPSNTQAPQTKELLDVHLSSQILTLQLVSKLKLSNIIFQADSNNYSMKKKVLQDVITLLIKIISTQETSTVLLKYGEYSCILDTMKKIDEMCKSNRQKESALKLGLKGETVNVRVDHESFTNEADHFQERFSTVMRDIKIKNQQHQKNKRQLAALQDELDHKVTQSATLKKQLYEAQQDMKKYLLTLKQIKRNFEEELVKLQQTKELERGLNLQLSEIFRKQKANEISKEGQQRKGLKENIEKLQM